MTDAPRDPPWKEDWYLVENKWVAHEYDIMRRDGPGVLGVKLPVAAQQREPQARLIAAAPDLVRALVSLRSPDGCWCDADGAAAPFLHTDACLAARAALVKAGVATEGDV